MYTVYYAYRAALKELAGNGRLVTWKWLGDSIEKGVKQSGTEYFIRMP
jgi:hypothetical protein